MPTLPQLLLICCNRANGTKYGYPGAGADCNCPTAQFIWKQSRVTGRFCGYPEIISPSSPPNYYASLNWSGSLSQTGEIPADHQSGNTDNSSENILGVDIPAHASYEIDVTGVIAYTNSYGGQDNYSPPPIDSTGPPCTEVRAGVCTWTGLLTKTTVWEWTIAAGTHYGVGDSLPDGSFVTEGATMPDGSSATSSGWTSTSEMSSSGSFPTTIPLAIGAPAAGPGGGGFVLETGFPNGWGNLIYYLAVPQFDPPYAGDPGDFGGPGGAWVPTSSTSQTYTAGGSHWTGSVTQSLTGLQNESTIISAATPRTAKFAGSELGGAGGYVELSSDSWRGGFGPNPNDGVDYVGPLWADRSGRMIDWADTRFALLVTKLIPNMPMKATVRIYRASYSVDTDGTPSYGSPSAVGSDLEYSFTPSDSWALIGADVPGGFDPTSFDPAVLEPTETLISGTSSQGWIYGAKIIAIEPQ